jgi:hypothetical protein
MSWKAYGRYVYDESKRGGILIAVAESDEFAKLLASIPSVIENLEQSLQELRLTKETAIKQVLQMNEIVAGIKNKLHAI